MCVSAMVLLNGLIGIFGDAFSSAAEDEEEEDEEEGDEDGSDDNKDKKKPEKGEDANAAVERIEQLCLRMAYDIDQLKNARS